jgi:hypothetical protein
MRRGAALTRASSTSLGGVVRAWVPSTRTASLALVIAALFTALTVAFDLSLPFLAWDSHAYWVALRSPMPYEGVAVGAIGSYLYPPPFIQALRPLGLLPWPVFAFGWFALLAGACISLVRRVPERLGWLTPLLLYVGGADVFAGNINVLLAFGIVLALEHPIIWAAPILTKVTPGIGALWHLFRGEWRALAIAAVTTAGLFGLSLLLGRDLWLAWIDRILLSQPMGGYPASLPIPLWARLPAAAAVVWWGARSGRPSLVPLACFLALPVVWFNGYALILACAVLHDTRVVPAAASRR